jgi:hypothetical protein
MSPSAKLATNLANRKWLTERVRAEIVGPDPASAGLEFNLGGESRRITWEEFRKPKKQINGEEVIWQDPPAKRYGAGVLFPVGVIEEREQVRAGEDQQVTSDIDPGDNQNVDERLEARAEQKAAKTPAAMDDSDDYAVTLANAFRPSAIGLSFLADFSVEDVGLRVEVVSIGRLGNDDVQENPSGRYKQTKVIVGELGGVPFPRSIWLRVPLLDDAKKYPLRALTFPEVDYREYGQVG